MKNIDILHTYYEKDGSEFVLIEERQRSSALRGICSSIKRILSRSREVAIGYSYDPEAERGLQYTLHCHGNPQGVDAWATHTRKTLLEPHGIEASILQSLLPHTITSDQWDIQLLNHILSTTGYLGVALEKIGIKST